MRRDFHVASYETFSVSESWTKELGSRTSRLLPVSSGLLWTSAATSIPDISLSVIAIDKRECNKKTVKKKKRKKGLQHAATMLTSYALYSLFTCTWHYASSIHWCPVLGFFFLINCQMVYQFYGRLYYTKRVSFFFIVVLHYSVHYASDTTLNKRIETPVLCS